MTAFAHISVQDVAQRQDDYTVVDIRDPQSFAMGHMPNASQLNNETLPSFLESTAKDAAVVVVCYHGISSQQAAQFLVEQGYSEVYSMDGGFEAWKLTQDVVTE